MTSTPRPEPDRIVSIAELVRRSSLSRTTIYRLMDAGDLERPRPITKQRVGWPDDYIGKWIADRVGFRDLSDLQTLDSYLAEEGARA